MYLTYIIIERYIIGGYSFIKNAIVLGGRKLSLRILKTLICLGTILKLSPKLYESINNSIISELRIRNFFKTSPFFFYFGACVKYDFSEKANVRGNISLPLLQKRNQS